MGLKDRLRKLRREAEEGAVVIHLRDGSRRCFEDMDVFAEMFLAKMGLFRGDAPNSPVLDAVRDATPESRRAFEDEYGPIEMEVAVVASPAEGGLGRGHHALGERRGGEGTPRRGRQPGGGEARGGSPAKRGGRLFPLIHGPAAFRSDGKKEACRRPPSILASPSDSYFPYMADL